MKNCTSHIECATRDQRIKELEAENERLKARVKEREGIVNYAHQCITANKSMGHRIEKLRAALEDIVTVHDSSMAQEALKELGEIE